MAETRHEKIRLKRGYQAQEGATNEAYLLAVADSCSTVSKTHLVGRSKSGKENRERVQIED